MRQNIKKIVGFTLIEMAVVLIIVGLLIGSGFSMIGPYIDNANQNHTKGSLENTKDALLNYVKVNRHMPCPDITVPPDGREDRTGNRCNGFLGTVPYDDIDISRGVASDDYGNVFGYGVHQRANNADPMGLAADNAALASSPGSYFYRDSAPVFTLNTPPTAAIDDVVAESFTVCRRGAADCTLGNNNEELEFIQAVVVAFNENGGVTNITSCNVNGHRSALEEENCNGDMRFIKGVFRDGEFDDQMVTISAYEIKEQVLDVLGGITVTDGSTILPDYEVIFRRDIDSTNDININNDGDQSVYVEGDINASANFKGGNDILTVTEDVNANINMANGNDTVTIEGHIWDKNTTIDLGPGNDTLKLGADIEGTIKGDTGDDTIEIVGTIKSTGQIQGNDGVDTVIIFGEVNGTIDMGKDDDELHLNGPIFNTVDGGTGDADVLFIDYLTQAEWEASGMQSYVTGFEFIEFNKDGNRIEL